jgi:hypothetical protein
MKVYIVHKKTCDVALVDSEKILSGSYYVFEHDALIAAERKRQQIIRDLEDELESFTLSDEDKKDIQSKIDYYTNKKIKVLQRNSHGL